MNGLFNKEKYTNGTYAVMKKAIDDANFISVPSSGLRASAKKEGSENYLHILTLYLRVSINKPR